MSLNNLASAVLLPPVNLMVLAIAGAVATPWLPRAGRIATCVGLAGMLVLSVPVVADLLVESLEQGLPLTPDPADPPKAIVILGGDVARRVGGGSDIGPLSLERVRAGAELARRTGLPILVTGGTTIDQGADVCSVMADSLQVDFNAPARWRECQSLDTWDNARLSAPALEAAGIRSIYLVTHAWHMPRGILAFGPTGLRVTAAPVGMDAGPDWRLDNFAPTTSAWHRSYYAIHEWVGIIAYRLRAAMP